jgi:hypothetical protein
VAVDPNPLLSLLRRSVVRIDHGGEFRGTGFFVAPGTVVTCGHVVLGLSRVSLTGAAGETTATIAARAPEVEPGSVESAFHPLPDLALLTTADSDSWQPCARLDPEFPAAGADPDQIWLTGFCRDSHQAGKVALSSAALEFEGELVEDGCTLLKLRDGQVIAGFSGSPLLNLRSGAVCGVLDSTRGETTALGGFGVPVAALAASFPDLLPANAAAQQRDPAWDRAVEDEETTSARRRGEAERLPLLSPRIELKADADYAPSDLLRPRYGLVPLVGREDLQGQLMRWRESEVDLGVVVITGSGGSGKTRLALEESLRAERAGWTAGLLSARTDASEAIGRLLEWRGRLLVTIDYAETRPDVVGKLLEGLARRDSGAPVRVLLVCRQLRSRQEWQEAFASGEGREEIAAVLQEAEPVPLDTEPIDRSLLFETGLGAIANRLGREPTTPTPSLDASHFERPLFVLAAALLCAEDPRIEIDSLGRDELILELIDRHESRYWQRWNRSLDTGLDSSLHARSVSVAALLGAEREPEALAVAGLIPGFGGDASEERHRQVARWLAHLYGDGRLDRPPAISEIEPDILAEALVARECSANPGLLGTMLDRATDTQLAHTLNLVARASAAHPVLAMQAEEALDTRLLGLMRRASVPAEDTPHPELIAALTLAVGAVRPKKGTVEATRHINSLVPPPLAVQIGLVAVEALREVDGYGDAAQQLTMALVDLAISLNRTASWNAALAVAEEGIERARAELGAGEEWPLYILALGLGAASNSLLALGQPAEALARTEEAVERWRALSAREPDRFLSYLADSLGDLAEAATDLGQREKALEASREAVERHRALAGGGGGEEAALCFALAGHSQRLGEAGLTEEALGVAEEAVSRSRALVERASRYLLSLAEALLSLNRALDAIGRRPEALKASAEAVRHFRTICEYFPRRYLPSLAVALNRHSIALAGVGRFAASSEAAEEALDYWRPLVDRDGRKHLSGLATALDSSAALLLLADRPEEAQPFGHEAVLCWRQLVEGGEEWRLPDLARSLNTLYGALAKSGQPEQALSAISAAVDHFAAAVERQPGQHRYELAGCLSNLSVALGRTGNVAGAVKASERAVAQLRALQEEDAAYLPELAKGLSNLAIALGVAGEDERALAVGSEALDVYRALVALGELGYLPDLAQALSNHSKALREVGRLNEAIEAAKSAVDRYRSMVADDEERFEHQLAEALGSLARALHEAGRSGDVLPEVEEALREARTTGGRARLTLVMARAQLRGGDLPAALQAAWAALREAERMKDPVAYEFRGFLRRLRIDEPSFDEAWSERIGVAKPIWLEIPEPNVELIMLVDEWARLTSVESARSFLEAHDKELLTDAAEAALEHMIEERPGEKELAHRRAVLAMVRDEGIETVFARLAVEEARADRAVLFASWASRPSSDEALRFLEENSEHLLEPAFEEMLVQAGVDHPEDIAPFRYVGVIGLARSDGPRAAFEALEDPPTLTYEESVGADRGSRLLALARLRAGVRSGDPDDQLRHAIAAAVSGLDREAEVALAHCRGASSSWEATRQAHTLQLLANQAGGRRRGSLRKLARSLTETGA